VHIDTARLRVVALRRIEPGDEMRGGRVESDGGHPQLLLEHGTYAYFWSAAGAE
jgi:hypothetical protein